MSRIVVPANARSQPFAVGQNEVLTVSGTPTTLEYTTGTLADIANGVAVWQSLSLSTNNDAEINKAVFVRAITGSTGVTLNAFKPTDSDRVPFLLDTQPVPNTTLPLVVAATGAGAGNSVILKTTGTFAADFQAANNALRDAGGGYIVLQAGGIYTLDSPVTLDCGTGVGLQGNGAWIDARGLSGSNITAITLGSTPPAGGPPIVGHDDDAHNYFQKRVRVEEFGLIGAGGSNNNTINGIDVNMATAFSTRAPRPTIANVVVQNFHNGLTFRNQGYLAGAADSIFTDCDNAIVFNGGVNPSENTSLRNVVAANSTIGVLIQTATETGSAQQFDVLFDTCSLDYNATQVKLNSGFGRARFHGGNYENNGVVTYVMNLATATNRCIFTFRDCYLNYTGTPSTGITNYFFVGANVHVELESCFLNNLLGSGQTVGSLPYWALANVSGSNSDFDCRNARSNLVPTLAPLASLSSNRSWLADPGFEATSLVDLWWIYKDGGSIVTTGGATARTAGTKIASIGTSTTVKNGGSRSLAITMNAEGALAAGNRVVGLLVPKRGDWFQGMLAAQLDGGSGSVTVTVTAAKVDDWTSQYTTNFSALAANTFVPTITQQSGTLFSGSTSPAVGSWGSRPFTTSSNTNAPRLQIPAWASHLFVQLDASAINNSSGVLYIDDFWITGF